jgi:cytochrome P450
MLLGMVLHPEVLHKAQQQLDEVLGDRLPGFFDRPSLPYIEAILREVLRWQPVAPTAFPHRLMEDDVYNGMFMPKGSLVVGNAW